MRTAERGQQGHDAPLAKGVRYADAQHAARLAGRVDSRVARLLQFVQQRLEPLPEHGAGFGHGKPARAALEQTRAQLGFERCDAARYRGRIDLQFARRGGEAAQANHEHQRFEVGSVHAG